MKQNADKTQKRRCSCSPTGFLLYRKGIGPTNNGLLFGCFLLVNLPGRAPVPAELPRLQLYSMAYMKGSIMSKH